MKKMIIVDSQYDAPTLEDFMESTFEWLRPSSVYICIFIIIARFKFVQCIY